jgi:hypothetical protein
MSCSCTKKDIGLILSETRVLSRNVMEHDFLIPSGVMETDTKFTGVGICSTSLQAYSSLCDG